jgi:hypothetical protein
MDTTTRKKPAPDLLIRLVGPGMKPWVVPMRALARIFDAVQRLVEQIDDEEVESILSDFNKKTTKSVMPEERVLRLINVGVGSALYQVAVPKPELATRVITHTGKSIDSPVGANWTQPTLSSLRELSDIARSLGCTIELRQGADPRDEKGVLAKISPGTYDAVSTTAFIEGDTSVLATVERVGGATGMHCVFRPNPERWSFAALKASSW